MGDERVKELRGCGRLTNIREDIRDLRPLLAGGKKNRFWPIFARPSPSLKQPVLAR
jgi:hypothetical protein